MESASSSKVPAKAGRQILASITLCLSAFFIGCRSRGSGRYLLNVLGNYPGSDAAYVYDTAHGSLSRLCGDAAGDRTRCFAIATDARISTITASIVPEADISSSSELNLRIKFRGRETIAQNPVNGKCYVTDISVSPDGDIVLATLYSEDLRASGIWRLLPETSSWKQLSEWEKFPNWVTQPATIIGTDRILYLKVTREPMGLVSHLQRLSLSTGRSEQLFPDRLVASFAIGKSGQIAFWSQFGLEIMDQDHNSSLIVSPGFLSQTGAIQPGSLAWNLNHNKIALAVVDGKTRIAKLYEFDPITKGSSLILSRKLGSEVSIQQLY